MLECGVQRGKCRQTSALKRRQCFKTRECTAKHTPWGEETWSKNFRCIMAVGAHFYARKQLLPSQFCPSVPPSVCLSVRHTGMDQSKTVQARITISKPSAAGKTLISATVKLFYKSERSHPERKR